MSEFLTLGGRVRCTQCSAKSKRTKQRCNSPAIRGKKCCAKHGGLSTGPKTTTGRLRCAEAKTIHGMDTRKIRQKRRELSRELYELETEGRRLGFITGPKTPGRKPKI